VHLCPRCHGAAQICIGLAAIPPSTVHTLERSRRSQASRLIRRRGAGRPHRLSIPGQRATATEPHQTRRPSGPLADACRLPSLPAPAARSPQPPADPTAESNTRPLCGSWRRGTTQCCRDNSVERSRPFQNGTKLFGDETHGMAPAKRTASGCVPSDDARHCSLAWRSSTASAGRPDSLLTPVDYFRHRLPSRLSPRRPANRASCT
jgi:hypothetical protein